MRLFICKPQLYFFFNAKFNMMHGETKNIFSFFIYKTMILQEKRSEWQIKVYK